MNADQGGAAAAAGGEDEDEGDVLALRKKKKKKPARDTTGATGEGDVQVINHSFYIFK
mgnify:CR=1 FL=1